MSSVGTLLTIAFSVLISSGSFGQTPTQPATDSALAAPTGWAAARAVSVGVESETVSAVELRSILKLANGARVLGFGEFMHGGHEPLAARNRWIRILIEQGGFTAVALESGLAQSRQVNDYILGGPGDVEEVTRNGFTWTFERFPANLALVRWLRAWNSAHPHHTVRFYGADVTGGDDKQALGRAGLVVDEVQAYLGRTLPQSDLPTRLRVYASRFDQNSWSRYSSSERVALRLLVADLRNTYDHNRARMIATSSASAYAWSRLMVEDMGQLADLFDVWPVEDPRDRLRGLKVAALRDHAMADYVLWALAQEGAKGRILSFAANGHVTRKSFIYDNMPADASHVKNMGEYLAEALGPRYRTVLTASSGRVEVRTIPGSLDVVLMGAGDRPYLLDLRGAPDWWSTQQTATFGDRVATKLAPSQAASGLLFVGRVTEEPQLIGPANAKP